MAGELSKESLAFIAKLLQRLGNEEWGKRLAEEKQAIDVIKIPPDEIATVCREQSYTHLLKKIEDEIEFLKKQ